MQTLIKTAIAGVILCVILEVVNSVTEIDYWNTKKATALIEMENAETNARLSKTLERNEKLRAKVFEAVMCGDDLKELKGD